MSQTQTLPLPVVSIDAVDAGQVPQTAAWAFTAPDTTPLGTVMSGGATNGTAFIENATDEVTIPGDIPVSIDAMDTGQSPQTAAWAWTVGVANPAGNLGANLLGDCLGNAVTDQRHPGGVS